MIDQPPQVARSVAEPPAVLQQPYDVPTPAASLKSGVQITDLHIKWRELSDSRESARGQRVRLLLRRIGLPIGNGRHSQDPELLGSFIRAADELATRSDQLADRLHAVELRLNELMLVVSEELAQIKAELASDAPSGSGGPSTDKPPLS